jgi:hypothetical protein
VRRGIGSLTVSPLALALGVESGDIMRFEGIERWTLDLVGDRGDPGVCISALITDVVSLASEQMEAMDTDDTVRCLHGCSVSCVDSTSSPRKVDNASSFSCRPFRLFIVGNDRCLSVMVVVVEESRDVVGSRWKSFMRDLALIGMTTTFAFLLENFGALLSTENKSPSSPSSSTTSCVAIASARGEVGGVTGRVVKSPHNPPVGVLLDDDMRFTTCACACCRGRGIAAVVLDGRTCTAGGTLIVCFIDSLGLGGGDNQPLNPIPNLLFLFIVEFVVLVLVSLSLPLPFPVSPSATASASSSVTSLLNGLDRVTGELPPDDTLDLAK